MKSKAALLVILSMLLTAMGNGLCRADVNDVTDGVAWFTLATGATMYFTISAAFDGFLAGFSDETKRYAALLKRARKNQVLGRLAIIVGIAAPALFLEGDRRKGCYIPLVFLAISQFPEIIRISREFE